MIRNRKLLRFAVFTVVGIIVTVVLSQVFFNTGIDEPAGAAAEQSGGLGTSQRIDGQEGVNLSALNAEGITTEIPADFALKLKNGMLELYYKEETGEVALREISTGAVYFSNPQDRESESYAQGTVKKSIASQLEIAFFNSDGTRGLLDSFNYSVAYKNLSASLKDNVLSVTYKIGKEKVTINDVPQQMSQERLEQLLLKLPEKDAADLLAQYTLVKLNDNDSAKVKESKLQKYKNIASNPIYFLKYTTDRVLAKVKGYLDAAGYTTQDLISDNTENGIEAEIVSIPNFTVVLEYTIDGDSLVVTLDTKKMVYQKNTPISEIRLLEYFGAGNSSDQGYLLVPDGSGSLIYFNNKKGDTTPFSMRIYGKDYATKYYENYQVDETARLPVCGIKKGGAALMISMEQGESLAEIDAYVSRMRTSYNNVFFTIHPVAVEKVNLAEKSNWANSLVASESNPYDGAFVIRYTPVTNDPTYSGIATAYRNRLKNLGYLNEKQASDKLAFHLTLLGGVSVQKTVLGITYDAIEAMTDFKQAEDILSALNEGGVADVDVRYLGWFNKGVTQQLAGSVKVLNALGGSKGLSRFSEAVAKNGGILYPDVYFYNIYSKGNGFRSNRDNVRSLNRDISVSYFYNPVSGYRNYEMDSIFKLSANKIDGVVKSFMKSGSSISLKGICTADLSSDLSSDYSEKASLSRPQSQQLTMEAQKQLHEKYKIMASTPNLYSLPEADEIIGISTDDSGFDITDLAVPFYQMVIHGYYDYSSAPLNYTSDYQNAYLSNIEYGAGVNYLICAENLSLLKYSNYSFFYTGMKDDWLSVGIKDYNKAAGVLSEVNNLLMVSHQAISEYLFCTTYEDQTRIYVNYGDKNIEWDGITVPAKGFAAKKG